ncbi:MAG TPA: BCAM0308 family protein [Candidatus Binatia bacterium]|jgi:NMD protein affecting ribosome stability and mRNA decay|nr:BCAM0308 family protein [Candidatus Binatia bacterium]
MSRQRKRYNTAYKKEADVERDVYLFKRSPKGLLSCQGCGAVYYRQRWTLEPPAEIRKRIALADGVSLIYCPGCQKIRDHYWLGVVQISGVDSAEKVELLKLLRNEERRAREKNPLERIMRIVSEDADLRVETTTEKLAQRLGRCLYKARGGRIDYKWSHRNKFARVIWENKRSERDPINPVTR